jgi:hypothetical protein
MSTHFTKKHDDNIWYDWRGPAYAFVILFIVITVFGTISYLWSVVSR